MEPQPAIVDEVPFEKSDIADVRAPPFHASSSFFDHASGFQFGEGEDEDEWEDEDDEEGGEPECRPQ